MNDYKKLEISGIIIVHSHDRMDIDKLKKSFKQIIKNHYKSCIMIINKENLLEQ